MGAIVFRSGEAAIASGSFNLMADSLLQLNYISSEEALLNGDLVVTSGLGGYYPSNLVIGEVEEVITTTPAPWTMPCCARRWTSTS